MNVRYRRGNAGICLVFASCQLLVGCIGFSGIRTMIHDDPHSQVSLEWVSQESFRASHPADLSPMLMKRILNGVMVEHSAHVIGSLLNQEARPVHVFSDDDIEQLLPHLIMALSQATPEEHVVFKSMDSQVLKMAGTLYIRTGLLFLTITDYARNKSGLMVTVYKGNRAIPDSSGISDVHISFTPETAWHQDNVQHPRTGGPSSSTKTLVVDYQHLARLPK